MARLHIFGRCLACYSLRSSRPCARKHRPPTPKLILFLAWFWIPLPPVSLARKSRCSTPIVRSEWQLPRTKRGLSISTISEVVSVTANESIPQTSTDTSENLNANDISREALDRVPVFDQDYI